MQEKTENNTKTIHRLAEYITKIGISFNRLSLELGLSNSYFNKMVKNGGSIGSDIIENILRVYPDINADWLLTGSGSMLRNNQSQLAIQSTVQTITEQDSSGEAAVYYKMYKEKDIEVSSLKEEIGALKLKISQLEAGNLGGKRNVKNVFTEKHSSLNTEDVSSASAHLK